MPKQWKRHKLRPAWKMAWQTEPNLSRGLPRVIPRTGAKTICAAGQSALRHFLSPTKAEISHAADPLVFPFIGDIPVPCDHHSYHEPYQTGCDDSGSARDIIPTWVLYEELRRSA